MWEAERRRPSHQGPEELHKLFRERFLQVLTAVPTGTKASTSSQVKAAKTAGPTRKGTTHHQSTRTGHITAPGPS